MLRTQTETRPMIEGEFQDKNIISIDQFTREDVEHVLEVATAMKEARERKDAPDFLANMMIKAVMFEDSSRTAGSFVSAASYLGANFHQPNLDTSSRNKGESDIETVLCFAGQSDGLVLRHRDVDFMDLVARRIKIPFQNGGNEGKHPTQTLIDLYTMKERYGSIDGLKVTIAGNVAKYRAAISLVKGLSLFEDIDLTVAAPVFARMPEDVIEQVRGRGMKVTLVEDLRPHLKMPGVVYICRPPQEYCSPAEQQAVLDAYEANGYNISHESMAEADPRADIFHPLPHNGEISDDFYTDPRAVYFEQEDNGTAVRMAGLALQHAQHSVKAWMPLPSTKIAPISRAA